MVSFLSCIEKKEPFPPEPQIYYQSVTPNTINILDTTAITRIHFTFTDGDGDIGTDPAEGDIGIFVKDSRDTSTIGLDYTYEYPFPYIPTNIRGSNGIEGSVVLTLGREYYRNWDSLHLALGKDTLVWSVYIKDLAGNKSNVITTDSIYVEYY